MKNVFEPTEAFFWNWIAAVSIESLTYTMLCISHVFGGG